MRLVLVGVVCIFSITLVAQQPQNQPMPQQQNQAVQDQQPANQNSQSGLGTVRNDRTATMPQVGYSAQIQTQNEFVGCVSGSGNNLVLQQRNLRRTYHLKGNVGQLQGNIGKLVKVSGRLEMTKPAAIQVEQVEVVQDVCNYAHGNVRKSVNGEAGNMGEALPVATTDDWEQVTPGAQSMINTVPGEEGRKNEQLRQQLEQRRTAAQGADPNFEETMQNPDDAQRIAAAAHMSELDNPQAQLGVTAQPNYSNANNPSANAQAVQQQAQQSMDRSASDQAAGSAQQPPAQGKSAQSSAGNATSITGCLRQGDKGGFSIQQQATGTSFRVNGESSKLRDHVNHTVQIVGNKTGTYGPAVGTSGNTVEFHVQAIQDVSPTCRQ